VHVALVVSGRESRFAVGKLDDAEDPVRARILDPDAPGAAVTPAEDSQVAPRIDERVADAVPAEQRDEAVDGLALRDAAEVEPDPACLGPEQAVADLDRGKTRTRAQPRANVLGRRRPGLGERGMKAPQLDERADAGIERPAARKRRALRFRK